MITELEAGKTYKLIDKEGWIATSPFANTEIYNYLGCDNILIDSVTDDGTGMWDGSEVIMLDEYEFFEEVASVAEPEVSPDLTFNWGLGYNTDTTDKWLINEDTKFVDPFMKLKKKEDVKRKERLQRVEDLLDVSDGEIYQRASSEHTISLEDAVDEVVTNIKTRHNSDGTPVYFLGKGNSIDKALAELADLGKQAVEDYNKLCQNASEAPEHGCNCSEGGCSCEVDKVTDSGSEEVLELFKGPIKSDGGSSSYYDIKLPQKVVDFVKENGYIKTEQIIEALGSDFDIGNIMKCTVRINSLMNGVGKEGNDVSYDASKIIYSANRLKERN